MNTQTEIIPLGKTDILIPPLGLGAWAWGDRVLWGYGLGGYTDNDIKTAFDLTLEAGVNFIDTAEAYGSGRSERLLGSFIKSTDKPVIVATKFMPYPWRLTKGTLVRALRASLKRLDLPQVDLYQIHWPWPPLSIETWADALVEVKNMGLTRAVGVSNYSKEQMLRTYEVLEKHQIPLASNQVQYSLLNRQVEFNGLLETCQKLGVTLIAYSPIAKGALTGKYTPENPPPGLRRWTYDRRRMLQIQPLIDVMREIGQAHGGKTPSQVALNWVISKGAVPIPGAKNARQAQDNIGAMGWRLTADEMAQLDRVSAPLTQ